MISFIGEHLDCFLLLLVSRTGTVGWTECWVKSVHSLWCFWPLTASITKEVKNNHVHVTTQRILNRFNEINFSVGCMVWPWIKACNVVYFKIRHDIPGVGVKNRKNLPMSYMDGKQDWNSHKSFPCPITPPFLFTSSFLQLAFRLQFRRQNGYAPCDMYLCSTQWGHNFFW